MAFSSKARACNRDLSPSRAARPHRPDGQGYRRNPFGRQSALRERPVPLGAATAPNGDACPAHALEIREADPRKVQALHTTHPPLAGLRVCGGIGKVIVVELRANVLRRTIWKWIGGEQGKRGRIAL